MDESERLLRKQAIDATAKAWCRIVETEIPQRAKRRKQMQVAFNEALCFMGKLDLGELQKLFVSSEQMEKLAHDVASAPGPIRDTLLGKERASN